MCPLQQHASSEQHASSSVISSDRGRCCWPQVLEILNDAEVRRLSEGTPPAALLNGSQPEAEPAPRVPFWQWAARTRATPEAPPTPAPAQPLQRAA